MALPLGVQARAPSALFYMVNTQKSMDSFLQHADKIDVLVPTGSRVDENGLVSGQPNPYALKVARAHQMSLTPIISAGASRAMFHQLLGSKETKRAMIAVLIVQARVYDYAGFRFDFGNIAWADRHALVKQDRLQDFCSWTLGAQNPARWNEMSVVRQASAG